MSAIADTTADRCDENVLEDRNARRLQYRKAHPADTLANPPKLVMGGAGACLADIDEHETLDLPEAALSALGDEVACGSGR